MLGRKHLRRLTNVASFGTRQVLMMLGNAMIAWFVLRQADAIVWGAFVKIFLWISLLCHLLNYGNRDYLLRSFADVPSRYTRSFQEAFCSRAVLIPGALILLFLWVDTALWGWLTCWTLAQFTYHSLDVFIFHFKRFRASAIIELAGLLLIILLIIGSDINHHLLVKTFALSFSLRAALLIAILPAAVWKGVLRGPVHLSFFWKARWFFLIGFSGLLQSRIDLYTISLYLSDFEVGRYQIMISVVLLVQVSAAFILTPYAINLMRLPVGTIRKTVGWMRKVGIPVAGLGVTLAFLLLSYLYQIQFTWPYYLWSFVLVYPTFVYLPWIYYLYGQQLEKEVMRWNFVGAVANLGMTIVLIAELGMLGALVSSAIVQLILMCILPMIGMRQSAKAES